MPHPDDIEATILLALLATPELQAEMRQAGVDRLTQSQTAEMLGIAQSAVWTHEESAMRKLRKAAPELTPELATGST